MQPRAQKRLTVEECVPLRISDLARARVFSAQSSPYGSLTWSSDCPALGYKVLQFAEKTYFALLPGEQSALSQAMQWIEVQQTECNYGGKRFWFCCPGLNVSCGRRVTALYRAEGHSRFACRLCHGLTYESCQRHDARIDRAVRNLDYLVMLLASPKLRHRLLGFKAANRLLAGARTTGAMRTRQ